MKRLAVFLGAFIVGMWYICHLWRHTAESATYTTGAGLAEMEGMEMATRAGGIGDDAPTTGLWD